MHEIIKKRKIAIRAVTDESFGHGISEALSKKAGIKRVEDLEPGRICVEYDLLKVRLAEIETEIGKLGYEISDAFLSRWIRWIWIKGWIKSMEQNEYDNLMSKPTPCCSNPEETLRTPRRRAK